MKAQRLWLSASAVALLWSGHAQAQDSTAPETPAGDASASAAESDTAPIIITARRRSENLMRTPTSGSVLSGNDLANKGVVNVETLQFSTPSVVVNNFGQGIDFNVRGYTPPPREISLRL